MFPCLLPNRVTLRDLITCFLTTLMTISTQSDISAKFEHTADEPLRQGLHKQLIKSETNPTLHLIVLHLSALCEMFACVPYVTHEMNDSTCVSLVSFLWKSGDAASSSDDCTQQEKLASDTRSSKVNKTPVELMEFCLTLLEVLYKNLEDRDEFAGHPEVRRSFKSEAVVLATFGLFSHHISFWFKRICTKVWAIRITWFARNICWITRTI